MSEETKNYTDEEIEKFMVEKRRKEALDKLLNGEKKEVMQELYNNYGLKAMVDDDPAILENETALTVAIKAAKQTMANSIRTATTETEESEKETQTTTPPQQRGGAQLMADAEKDKRIFLGDLTAKEIAEKSKGNISFHDAVIAKAFLVRD